MKQYDPDLYGYEDFKDRIPTELVVVDGFIFVVTSLDKFQVNNEQLRWDGTPRKIFEYVIPQEEQKLFTRTNLRENAKISTQRDFRQVLMKAGFTGLVRAYFVRHVDKDSFELITKRIFTYDEMDDLETELT